MKYRVVFRGRRDLEGESSDDPKSFLDAQLDDDTVVDAELVTRNDPDSLHNSEVLDEDDAFLSIGTEVWDFDVAEGKDEDFKAALQNSGMVIEFEPLEAADELGLS